MQWSIDTDKFFAYGKWHRPPCQYCRYQTYCVLAVFRWNRAVSQFPNACESCHGTGMFDIHSDDSPCWCVEQGKCPRCGSEMDYDGDVTQTCPSCGMVVDDETVHEPVIPDERPECMVSPLFMVRPDEVIRHGTKIEHYIFTETGENITLLIDANSGEIMEEAYD